MAWHINWSASPSIKANITVSKFPTELCLQVEIKFTRAPGTSRLINWVKVLHHNQHRIGHLGNILSILSIGWVLKKSNPTQQKQATQE